MSSARFRPADRVLLAREYAHVRRRGRRWSSKNFAVSVAPREGAAVETAVRGGEGHLSRTRLGMAVSRKVGNAVARNRVKRAIREWFRHSREQLTNNVDIVVIARSGAASQQTREIARELTLLLSRPSDDKQKSRARK